MNIDADKASKLGELHRTKTSGDLGSFTKPHDQGIDPRFPSGHLGELIRVERIHVPGDSFIETQVSSEHVQCQHGLIGLWIHRSQGTSLESYGRRIEKPDHAELFGKTIGNFHDTETGQIGVLGKEGHRLAKDHITGG